MTNKMKVAAIQTGLFLKSAGRAVAESESLVRDAAKQGARLICLPEHWLLSKTVPPENDIYSRFSHLATRLDVYINLGSIYEKHGRDTFLLSPTVAPSGEIIAKQPKVHLYGREKEIATPGKGFETFKVNDVTVGVLVCHDAVFPESARTSVLKGAELLLVPSLIVSNGIYPWHIYLLARALENRVPVVSANAYMPPRFLGKSTIIDLKYDSTQHVMQANQSIATDGKAIALAELDIDEKTKFREERLHERRTEAYEL